MALIDEELTYELRGCFFDVQKQVGFGLPGWASDCRKMPIRKA